MTRKQKLAVSIAGLLLAFVAVMFLIDRLFPSRPQPEGQVVACYALIDSQHKLDVTVGVDESGAPRVVFGGETASGMGISPKRASQFISCVERVLGANVEIDNIARQDLEPIGQVADNWQTPGLTIQIWPSEDPEIANNLRVRPDVGFRAEIISRWCNEYRACVTCDPADPTEETPQVLIRLLSTENASRVQMPGRWPVPTGQTKPWQLVDQAGRRFLYDCTASES